MKVMVYITIKYCFESILFVCNIQIQFRLKQVHEVLAGQDMDGTVIEVMEVILRSKMTYQIQSNTYCNLT